MEDSNVSREAFKRAVRRLRLEGSVKGCETDPLDEAIWIGDPHGWCPGATLTVSLEYGNMAISYYDPDFYEVLATIGKLMSAELGKDVQIEPVNAAVLAVMVDDPAPELGRDYDVLHRTDGTSQTVEPAGEMWTNEELNAHVGGHWETFPIPGWPELLGIANENGIALELPWNPVSMRMCRELYGPILVIHRRDIE